MEGLSPDIQLRIFSYLEPCERLVVCAAVCRQWRRLVKEPSLWRCLHVPPSMGERLLRGLLRKRFVKKGVDKLIFTKFTPLVDLLMPNLVDLHIWKLRHLDWNKIRKLNPKNLIVEHAKVKYAYPGDFLSTAKTVKEKCPDVKVILKNLKVRGFRAEIGDIARVCEIKHVNGSELYDENAEADDQLLGSLGDTDLSYKANLTYRVVKAEDMLPVKLTDVMCSSGLSWRYLASLVPVMCPHLVKYSVRFDDVGPEVVQPLKHLKQLRISVSEGFDAGRLVPVVKAWGGLEKFELSYAGVTVEFLSALTRANRQLREMEVRFEKPAELPSSRLVFPGLKELSLNSSNKYLLAVLSCPNLYSLGFGADFPPEDDYKIFDLCSTLKRIELGGITGNTCGLLTPLKDTLREVLFFSSITMCEAEDRDGVKYLKDLAQACPDIRLLAFGCFMEYHELPEDDDEKWEEEFGQMSGCTDRVQEALNLFPHLTTGILWDDDCYEMQDIQEGLEDIFFKDHCTNSSVRRNFPNPDDDGDMVGSFYYYHPRGVRLLLDACKEKSKQKAATQSTGAANQTA